MAERTPRSVAGRARVQRDQILDAMAVLTDARIDDLARRGELASVIDGFKASTLGDGRGTSGATSVESAVLRRAGFKPGGDENEEDAVVVAPAADPVAGVLNDLFGDLRSMSNLAVSLLRRDENLRFDRERANDPVDPDDPDRLRQSTLQGSCLCCTDKVSGAEWDRLRRGLCNRCYHAWRVWAPGESEPSVGRFCFEMAEQLSDEDEVGVDEKPAVAQVVASVGPQPGGFVHGIGTVDRVVRASSQVNAHVGEVT